MTWIVEEPVYIAILGVSTVLICGFGWLQTGYRQFAYAVVGAVIATVLLLLVEQWVETERAGIESALRRMAQDVERNDLPTVLSDIAQSAAKTRRRAESEFPRYRFTRVSIKHNLTITIDREQQPPKAKATFNVVVDGSELSTNMTFHVPRYVELTLVNEGSKWKVSAYHHEEPHLGLGPRKESR